MAIKILTDEETAFFCEQLAMLMEAGIPLADGMEVLAEEGNDRRFREISAMLAGHMREDVTLFDAMDKLGIFPDYAVKTVKIGAVTGRLEDALRGLSDYYSKRSELRQTVKSSVSHPFILLAMMTAVIIVLVIKIIPMFREIYAQFDETAAKAAEDSVSFAYRLGAGVMVALVVILGITLVTALLMKIPSARRVLNKIFTNFVLTRGLSEAMAMADITNAMTMMAECGISPEQSLELAAGLTENKNVLNRIKTCEKLVLDGEYFADAIKTSELLPGIYAHSLKVAYKSGAIDSAWQKISLRFGQDCDRKIYGAVSFIEPAIVGVLAVMIGSVLLTVMLPLTDIMSRVG